MQLTLRRLAVVAVLASIAALLVASPVSAHPAGVQRGVLGAHPYVVYTPESVAAARSSVPLVVVVHGCQTTADQQMHATRFNRLADREGFAVLYPDVDRLSRSLPGPLHNCWRFFDPDGWTRGHGDAGAIARITRKVASRPEIDTGRIYLAGMSAGGFMTSILSATDPDLYSAVAVVAGGPYADPTCLFGSPVNRPVRDLARDARTAMGSRARVVPRLVIGGDRDEAVTPECQRKALEQGLLTNDLVLRGQGRAGVRRTPVAVRSVRQPGRYRTTVRDYRYGDCLIAQRWTVHGMGHFWPGGSPDPKWAAFTDPKGPDAAELTWRYFTEASQGCLTVG